MKLTGNLRLRTEHRWFKSPILVLEVEETGYLVEYTAGHIDGRDISRWRDARIEDVPFRWDKNTQ